MEMQSKQDRRRKTLRRIGLMTLFVMVAAMVVPLSGYVYVAMAQETEQVQAQAEQDWATTNPRSEVWRQARQATEGVTRSQSPGANVLMTSSGETFRQIRNGPIATISPWYLAVMVGAVVLFFLISGGGKKLGNPSGKRVPRWSLFDRVLHWYVAILFLTLAITGLSLLFGRAVLIPLLGPEGFAAWAMAAKNIHNYGGALFVVGILLMIVTWIRYNIPSKVDLQWFLKGGLFGKHAPAGMMNGGEKAWFWLNVVAGIIVSATGIMMILPHIFESRELFQLNLIIHAIVAIFWLGASFGHMYMATLGAPGSMEGMIKGDVSREWAESHHDLWYEDVKHKEFDAEEAQGQRAPQAQASAGSA